MRAELEQIALVEDYLEGRLSGDSLSDFEQRLAIEPDLKNAVDMQKVVMEAVVRAGRSKISEELNKAYEMTRPEEGFKWNSAKGYMIAAAAVGVLAIGAYAILDNPISDEAKPNTEVVDDKNTVKVINPEAGELNLEIIPNTDDGMYSFVNGKLTLYGEYDAADVYVEELFGTGEYYLHYKKEYYNLIEGAEKQRLEAETDPDILQLFQ